MNDAKNWFGAALGDAVDLDREAKPVEPTPNDIPTPDWSIADLEQVADLRNKPSEGIRPQARARPRHLREDCEICGGSGSVLVTVDSDGKPDRDGGYSMAYDCICVDLEGLATSYNRIGMPPAYANANIEQRSPANPTGTDWTEQHMRVQGRKGAWSMRSTIEHFIEAWVPGATALDPSDDGYVPGLLLCGPNGTGKSRAAALICMSIATRQRRRYAGFDKRLRRPDVRMVEWTVLIDMVKSNFGTGVPEEVVLAPYIDADLLWLDELGKGHRSEWSDSIAERVVCRRMDAMKTTIVTTNLVPYASMVEGWKGNDLGDHIGERARSRLMGCCKALLMDGPDYRRKRHA